MSEFGKGLCYCIGLFLAHAEREVKTERDAGLWFNAASDHLIELQVEDAPKSVRNRLKEFAWSEAAGVDIVGQAQKFA